jgi:hypothetical protein
MSLQVKKPVLLYRHPIWAIIAAFGTYFCMYGFRKPYTAADFDGYLLLGIGYKTVLVSSQIIGYALSKFIGIKIISELGNQNRTKILIGFILFAQLMLIGFGLVPASAGILFLFLNGLPLGMVYGIVQSYLEGRKMTEALIAGLCISFILADGFTKSLGSYLLQLGTSPFWMPGLAGFLFLLPTFLFIWMLTKIPPPSQEDEAHRVKRSPLSRKERGLMLKQFGLGIFFVGIAFLLITLLRSFRADFALEIWQGLQYEGIPSVFIYSELWIALGIILSHGFMVLIKSNKKAFFFSLILCNLGFLLILLALFAQSRGLDGFWFMVLSGLGIYIPYVTIHTTVFERLIATFRQEGNIGFFMYIVDSMGYIGYVFLLFSKEFIPKTSIITYFNYCLILFSIFAILFLLMAIIYFQRKLIISSRKVVV